MASMIGIDIGAQSVKLAVLEKGKIKEIVRETMPRDLMQNGQVTSFDALGDFLGTVFREHKLRPKKCALVLPEAYSLVRHITLPMMKESHLRMNLPYEFHDFIQNDKAKYVFDYAVLGVPVDEDGNERLELMAAAARREIIAQYDRAIKVGKKKLVSVQPASMTLANLIPDAPDGTVQEYCFIDLGHRATMVYIFRGRQLEATKTIEYGLNMLDQLISEQAGVDIHVAASYKESNYDHILDSEECQNFYYTIAVEVMRAINFYRFNNPDSTLTNAYMLGGGADLKPLVQSIQEQTDLTFLSPAMLLGDGETLTDGDLASFAYAIGAARG